MILDYNQNIILYNIFLSLDGLLGPGDTQFLINQFDHEKTKKNTVFNDQIQ